MTLNLRIMMIQFWYNSVFVFSILWISLSRVWCYDWMCSGRLICNWLRLMSRFSWTTWTYFAAVASTSLSIWTVREFFGEFFACLLKFAFMLLTGLPESLWNLTVASSRPRSKVLDGCDPNPDGKSRKSHWKHIKIAVSFQTVKVFESNLLVVKFVFECMLSLCSQSFFFLLTFSHIFSVASRYPLALGPLSI